MDTKQVNDALDKLFREERIVFWNDPNREFVGYLTGQLFSPVEGVKVIRLDQTAALVGLGAMRTLGVLHPNPVRPFDSDLLPNIEFGSVEIDRSSKRLHVQWPQGNNDS